MKSAQFKAIAEELDSVMLRLAARRVESASSRWNALSAAKRGVN